MAEEDKIPFFVACPNPCRANNLGPLIRCCVAFGAQKLILVGSHQFSTHGAHGSQKHIRTEAFMTWAQVQEEARRKGWSILGLCMDEAAVPVTSKPFTGPTLFIVPHKVGASENSLT